MFWSALNMELGPLGAFLFGDLSSELRMGNGHGAGANHIFNGLCMIKLSLPERTERTGMEESVAHGVKMSLAQKLDVSRTGVEYQFHLYTQ